MKNTLQLTALALGLVLLGSCAKPLADFNYTAKSDTAPATVSFENTSQKATIYEWDFGDGQKSTEASPQHRYRASGNYTITLRASDGKKESIKEQALKIGTPERCYVILETDFGSMTILLSDATPQHRDNFIKLVEDGFYDDLLFHRVINGFMIQGGDPDSRNASKRKALGSGGPGYQIPAEFVDSLIHVKGALAAARRGGPGNPEKMSSGSQFYIVQGRGVTEDQLNVLEAQKDRRYTPEERQAYLQLGGTPFLDNEYTVFGMVVDGLEVIDKIAATETNGDPPRGQSRPVEPVKMKIRVIQ
ncbi:MAG: peptidylprolyl isomerase [Bacteroidota bacterium]